jgi:hypothetical protein
MKVYLAIILVAAPHTSKVATSKASVNPVSQSNKTNTVTTTTTTAASNIIAAQQQEPADDVVDEFDFLEPYDLLSAINGLLMKCVCLCVFVCS